VTSPEGTLLTRNSTKSGWPVQPSQSKYLQYRKFKIEFAIWICAVQSGRIFPSEKSVLACLERYWRSALTRLPFDPGHRNATVGQPVSVPAADVAAIALPWAMRLAVAVRRPERCICQLRPRPLGSCHCNVSLKLGWVGPTDRPSNSAGSDRGDHGGLQAGGWR
jgi:hypothetical protein